MIQTDYIKKYKNRNTKFYRCLCDSCGIDRGYQSKQDSSRLCRDCNNKKIGKVAKEKKMIEDTKLGIVRAKDTIAFYPNIKCPRCGKDRGYKRRTQFDKLCRSCANSDAKKGKSSPLKGRKVGPNKNRHGRYYDPIKSTLRHRMSRRMKHALEGKELGKKYRHIFDILDYSVEDLKIKLESTFKDGMNWDNRGKWHIDHIIPCSYFDYKSFEDEDFKKCWSLDNLQALWAIDNIKKVIK